MTELHITEDNIPRLDGKVAIVTGGCAGIGLATTKILASKGATVIMVDLTSPAESVENAAWVKTDVSSWDSLKAAFKVAGWVDIVVANAGILGDLNWLGDRMDGTGELVKPGMSVIDANIVGVAMCIKLAVSYMRKQGSGGSIVLVASGIVYEPGEKVVLYAVTGMLRSLKQYLINEDITINAVAPGVTSTQLVNAFKPAFAAKNEPMGTPHEVGLAIVYSAVAREQSRIPIPGTSPEGAASKQAGRWNGRMIYTLKGMFAETEESFLGWREGISGDEGPGTNFPRASRPRTALKVWRCWEDGRFDNRLQ
ncbi:short chain dehydrogenase reductase [Tuber magnatum]|uniref:Short chain dehydrogenase reductase n=1 Tax=Tuber magnatum TaxID=42249 RepID=A0A317SUK8_9PEZI|nr:short chain dehydrogenase reductase [Tuber magnatum]